MMKSVAQTVGPVQTYRKIPFADWPVGATGWAVFHPKSLI